VWHSFHESVFKNKISYILEQTISILTVYKAEDIENNKCNDSLKIHKNANKQPAINAQCIRATYKTYIDPNI
jgi:hypothetical protein